MTVSDFSQYVDLRFDDRDASLIYADALTWMSTVLPEWVPREGNIEVTLLQALAFEVQEIIYAINRVPNAAVETILKLYGLVHDPGSPPVVMIKFFMADDLGSTIPAGTQVLLNIGTGIQPMIFTTLVDKIIPPGDTNGETQAVGSRYTAAANAVPIGTRVSVYNQTLFVDHVETSSAVTGGIDPESDDAYLIRGVQRLQRLSETYVLPSSFLAAALEDPDVRRAFVINNYNPASDPGNDGPVGNDGGHITVAVYGDGANLSTGQKNDLAAALEAGAAANLAVHVVNPTMNTQNVVATIKALPGYEVGAVYDSVILAIKTYLSPNAWGWGTTLHRFDLVGIIDAVAGVDYVDTMTTPSADVTLTGVAPLIQWGTLTITIT